MRSANRIATLSLILCFAIGAHTQDLETHATSLQTPRIQSDANVLESAKYAVAISYVFPESQAAELGLEIGDIILEVDGVSVGTVEEFRSEKRRAAEQDAIELMVSTEAGSRTVSVKPGPVGVGLTGVGSSGYWDTYNIGCRLAVAGNDQRAFAYLNRAVDDGLKDSDFMETDTDLQSLHEDPKWDAVLDKAKKALEEYFESNNRELYDMVKQDQADRSVPIESMDRDAVSARDKERRDRLEDMLKNREVMSADDHVRAAMIFQHGGGPGNYLLAEYLALRAVELGPSADLPARWMVAAAKDRFLINVGEPQWYGTQYRRVEGTWQLSPIDVSKVTDEERIEWDVPTLKEMKARIEKMNSQ